MRRGRESVLRLFLKNESSCIFEAESRVNKAWCADGRHLNPVPAPRGGPRLRTQFAVLPRMERLSVGCCAKYWRVA